VCVSGDYLDHEQDTVLQLQEVIEQLRNVFPSEPGEFFVAARFDAAPARHTSETFLLDGPRECERWRGEQICTAVDQYLGGDTGRLNGKEREEDKSDTWTVAQKDREHHCHSLNKLPHCI